jgi:hypothetical protein
MTAFAATYSDWKVIRGRKVVQIVFEFPLEKSDEAYAVLGGMPNPAAEVWCGIARLQEPGGVASPPAREGGSVSTLDKPDGSSSRTKRAWGDMSPSQQAGLLCGDPRFHQFLFERCNISKPDKDEAAAAVREICGVTSRAAISIDNIAWRDLVADFRVWERALI